MKTLISILILSSLTLKSYNQTILNDHEDRKYFAINVVTSGIISGVQSCIINKPKHQTVFKTFINGFSKGSLGGVVQYSSKKIIEVGAYKNTLDYVWPARIVNTIGNSICWNASQNKSILSTIHFQLYFSNLTYEFKTKKLDWQIDLVSLGYTTYLFLNKGYDFNLKTSIQTGSIYFDKNVLDTIYDGNYLKPGTMGTSVGNVITTFKYIKTYFYDWYHHNEKIDGTNYVITDVYRNIKNYKIQIMSHELIHIFQNNEFATTNLVTINKLYKYINSNILNHINISANFGLIYSINNVNYNNNIFENEADYFGKSHISDINNIWHY